ncbi:hypothetical protein MMC30_008540 [Trapelia coarctata]|nr:hypothetical protein [Trapelia coarctata]
METSIFVRVSVLLLFLYRFTYALKRVLRHSAIFPEYVPIVGVRKQVLSIPRASFRQLTNGITTLLDGYHQFAQHGQPFVVYDPSAQQELLLPVKHLKWFSEQPDSKLSSYGVRQERHALNYLNTGIELSTTMHFIERISGDRLARNLHLMQQPMHDEIRRCVDAVFGKNKEDWTALNVYDSLQDIVMPTMSRIFLGLPLGRDPRVITALRRYIMALGLGTIFVGELPRVLKVMVAPLVNLPLAYYQRKTLSILIPVVERQMAQGTTSDGDEVEELSFIRQCAKISEKSILGGVGNASQPEIIAKWIMSLAFAGASSTVIQATNLILDIANSPKGLQVSKRLRQEAEATLPSDEDWCKAASFTKQILADSVIRESLRYHPILIKGLTKEVVPSAGMQLPDGTQMPKGSWVGVPVLGIHRDKRYYANPDVYEPFRFVKARSSKEGLKTLAWEDELEAAKPTTTYLGFGYGRHACPGRWFAVLMLKMIIAYVSLNYDIEATGPPPKMKVIGDAALPPMSTTIKVRRRRLARD